MADGDQNNQQQNDQQQQNNNNQQQSPWHTGVEPEVLGHWQNRGMKLDDAKTVAIEMTKAHRAAEQRLGVPADQLLKLPKDASDEAGWKTVWQRLGAPAEAKDYDFSTVKDAAGNPLDARLADTIRASAAAGNLPKDAAAKVAADIVKHLDAVKAEQTAATGAKVAEERAALKANWKEDYDFHHLKAMEGARKLGITPEAVKALEGQIGYANVMEAMRKIGAGTSEDAFVEGGANRGAMTRDQAVARKADLMADAAWGKRLTAGDAEAKREWNNLNILIHGEDARAA